MFELLHSPKIGRVIQAPAAPFLFFPGSNLSMPSLQSCAASLCNAVSSGCGVGRADAQVHIKAPKGCAMLMLAFALQQTNCCSPRGGGR